MEPVLVSLFPCDFHTEKEKDKNDKGSDFRAHPKRAECRKKRGGTSPAPFTRQHNLRVRRAAQAISVVVRPAIGGIVHHKFQKVNHFSINRA